MPKTLAEPAARRSRAGGTRPAGPRGSVLSIRVAPEVAARLQQLAEDTGLSQGALVAMGVERLADDPEVRDLIAACRAWNAAMARVRRPRGGGGKAVGGEG